MDPLNVPFGVYGDVAEKSEKDKRASWQQKRSTVLSLNTTTSKDVDVQNIRDRINDLMLQMSSSETDQSNVDLHAADENLHTLVELTKALHRLQE